MQAPPFRQEDFTGGMVVRRSPGYLQPNECEWLENFDLTEFAYATKRGGWVALPAAPLPGPILGIHYFEPLPNDWHLLVACEGSIYRYNDITEEWDEIATGFDAFARVRFVNLVRMCVFMNGVDPVQKYYRVDPFDVDDPLLVAPLGGSPPVASFGALYYRHLFLNDVTNPVRIFYSETDDPEAGYGAINYLADMVVGDASPVTGFLSMDQELIIGKERSITALRGMNPRDFSSPQNRAAYSNDRGVLNPDCLIDVNGQTWFMSEDGVYSLEGAFSTPRQSFLIDGMFDEIDPADLRKAVAYPSPERDQAVFFASRFGGSANDMALVAHPGRGRNGLSAWTIWTGFAPTCVVRTFNTTSGERVYAGAEDGRVYLKRNQSFQDGAAPVVARYRSAPLMFGRPDMLKTLREVVVELDVGQYTEVKIYYLTDRGQDADVKATAEDGGFFITGLSETGDPLGGRQVLRRRMRVASRGLRHHVELVGDTNAELRISGIEAVANVLGRARGLAR